MSGIQVIPGITLSNVTPSNNLLMNLSFKNFIVGLDVLYVLNIHANFYTNHMLFTIRSINSFFMHYYKLKKIEFIQLIDDMIIDF